MNIYQKRLKKKTSLENEALSLSMQNLASSISYYHSAKNEYSHSIVKQLFKFFKISNTKLQNIIELYDKDLSSILNSIGVMERKITLKNNWYKEASLPILARFKNTNHKVLIIPKKSNGYKYYDSYKKKYININNTNCKNFDKNASYLYKSLPSKTLGIWDIIKYAINCINFYDLFYICLASLIPVLLGYFLPVVNYFVVDYISYTKDYLLLFSTGIVLISVVISILLINIFQGLFSSRISLKICFSLESAIMMRIMYLPAYIFNEYKTGDLTQRVKFINILCQLVVNSAFNVGLSTIFSFVYIIQVYILFPAMALYSLIIVSIYIALNIIIIVMQTKYNTKLFKLTSYNSGVFFSFIKGIQQIRIFGAEKRFFSIWANTYSKESRLQYNPITILRIGPALLTSVFIVAHAFFYYVVMNSNFDTSTYYSFITLFSILSTSFLKLSTVDAEISTIVPSLKMLEPFLKNEAEGIYSTKKHKKISGHIKVDKLSFSYKGFSKKIFDDISFEIKKGEYVAFVGSSGSGKSTLLKILLGFETPDRGTIYYDKENLETLDKSYLRKSIGTVMQDDKLLPGSIYSNIALCSPGLTQKNALHAAEIADLTQDINEMPMKLFTEITEGQENVSGGQKQKILIARAVASNPNLLILDEATSALDNISQRKVINRLDNMGCTRIVVAHRLSTIKNCDKIYCIDEGKIVEEGNFDQLLRNNNFFCDLIKNQQLS